MPGRWTAWNPLEDEYFPAKDSYGIYEIAIVDGDGSAIPVPRIGRVDDDGILYLGRSGLSTAKSRRDLANRLQEFQFGSHSGGETLGLIHPRLRRRLGKFDYRYRVMYLNDKDIENREKELLGRYFRKFCELPPCNSSFPGKYD